jgi:hypothetical protein
VTVTGDGALPVCSTARCRAAPNHSGGSWTQPRMTEPATLALIQVNDTPTEIGCPGSGARGTASRARTVVAASDVSEHWLSGLPCNRPTGRVDRGKLPKPAASPRFPRTKRGRLRAR